MIRIRPLHAVNVGDGKTRRQERILPVRLLPTSPARIAENIDVRRPGIETRADEAEAAALATAIMQARALRG